MEGGGLKAQGLGPQTAPKLSPEAPLGTLEFFRAKFKVHWNLSFQTFFQRKIFICIYKMRFIGSMHFYHLVSFHNIINHEQLSHIKIFPYVTSF